MNRRIFLPLVASLLVSTQAFGQSYMLTKPSTDMKAFSHLDVGVNLGTTGIGVELSAPVTDWMGVRAGFDFMPRVEMPMHFSICSSEDVDNQAGHLEHMSSRFYDMFGMKIDTQVKMQGKPTYYNAKLLVDFYPLRNKHWHVTAGFYYGNSRFAEAVNALADAPSLVSVNLYNRMYEKSMLNLPLITYEGKDIVVEDFKEHGRMGVYVGNYSHDVYGTYPEGAIIGYDDNAAPIRAQKGQTYIAHHKGDKYMLEPDENGIVRVKAETNKFKPYLGVGYGGRLLKNSDRYYVKVDAGVLFWGGAPKVYARDVNRAELWDENYNHVYDTHPEVYQIDLSRDVNQVRGHVGDYVDALHRFKVLPAINITISRSIF